MEFSERIREIKAELRNKGWKYADLAENSGIPLSTVLKVLSGNTRSPRVDTVEAIERALGLHNSIFTAEDYANGVRDTKKISITADQEDIFDKTNEVLEVLGEKGKNMIIDFCDALLDKFKN